MAELNPADPRRLANEFFTLRAGEAETAALGLELEADDGAALEFLGHARAAREGAPPAGPDAGAEAALTQGLEALIAAHARKPGLLRRLARRFRGGARGPQPPTAQAAPPSTRSAPALRPPVFAPPGPGRAEADMEDTVPMVEPPEPGSVPPAGPGPVGPPLFPPHRLPPPSVPAAAAPPPAVPKAAKPSSRRAVLSAALLLAVLPALGLYFQGRTLLSRAPWGRWLAPARAALASRIPRTWAPWLAPPQARLGEGPSHARPAPRPTPSPPAPALPLREDAASPARTVPLPVELPPGTPVQAGVWN